MEFLPQSMVAHQESHQLNMAALPLALLAVLRLDMVDLLLVDLLVETTVDQ